MATHILKNSLPQGGSKYSQGVTAIQNLKGGNLLVGCGDGTVEVISGYKEGEKKKEKTQRLK